MNLLPPEVLNKRKFLRLYMKMAAVQAVIFALAGLLAVLLEFTIAANDTNLAVLESQIQEPRFIKSEQLAALLRDQYRYSGIHAYGLYESTAFKPGRLSALYETLPAGVHLLNADLSPYFVFLSLSTVNLSLADIHMENLINTGLTEELRFVSAQLSEGAMQYVLSFVWQ